MIGVVRRHPAAAVAIAGVGVTALAFALVDHQVERMTAERIDARGDAAVVELASPLAGVDAALEGTESAADIAGLDFNRLQARLDAEATDTGGLALVVTADGSPMVAARAGTTELLDEVVASVAGAGEATTLVAHRQTANAHVAAFARQVVPGKSAAYVEMTLPIPDVVRSPYAVVDAETGEILLGNVRVTDGLRRAGTTIRVGGTPARILVGAPRGSGADAPLLVLLAGLALTAGAVTFMRRRPELGAAGRTARPIRGRDDVTKALLRTSPHPVAICDGTTGELELLHPKTFLGFTADTLPGNRTIFDLLDPRDTTTASTMRSSWSRLQGADVTHATLRCRDARGRERTVRAAFTQMPVRDGGGPRLLATLADITEDAGATGEPISTVIDDRAADDLRRLVGGVAHDLNTVLSSVLVSSELAADGDADERVGQLQHVQAAVGRGVDLAGRLAALGETSGVAAPVDLGRLLRDLAPRLEQRLGSGVRLEIFAAEPACVFADASAIEHVLVNLADNARDAMPAGGALTIDAAVAEDPDVPGVGSVVLTVTDTGSGISDAIRAEAFEPFVTTKPGHAGLGLAAVHEIVRQAGGTAEIEPTGDGTRVTVRLPWHATFAVPARPEPAELEPEPAGRVLLVDDDDAVRSSVAAMLRAAGYGVTVAGTAAEALALLDDGFDVVVADVVLPGISGPDLCFRVLARDPEIAIVLMSGYVGHYAAEDTPLERAVFVRKPFTRSDLLEAVAAALDRRHEHSTSVKSDALTGGV